MAGIYIHIPFCKQACHYCDFHFSTSLKKKGPLVEALTAELLLRKSEMTDEVKTVYFGGGTPSLLSQKELEHIFKTVFDHYKVSTEAEITLEANPDDLSKDKLEELASTAVNRLSIGVQSFFDKDLVWMNRSHNTEEALKAVETAKSYFDNLSIDLIYGVPGLSDAKWAQNLDKALALAIPHISSYALTVEPKTALAKMIKSGKKQAVDDAAAKRHYEILIKKLAGAGYVNYEFSNFGLPGYFSENNMAYWSGKPYLGIGPSAHGFDGKHRFWNVRNNTRYIEAITQGKLPQEREALSTADRYNEYVMTRLRTMWGVSINEIMAKFGRKYQQHFEQEAEPLFAEELLVRQDGRINISPKGKFLGDGISADLFYVQ